MPQAAVLRATALLLHLSVAAAWAQTPAEIDRAMRAQVVPQVPAAALDAQRQAVDLSALAAQYERMRGSPGAQDAPPSGSGVRTAQGLLVFASLGMPTPSLERLVADAEALGAVIVLRGVLGGSLQTSLKRIEALMGQRRVSWQIDPPLFERFAVRAVPAYVLVDPSSPVQVACGAQACSEPVFAMVGGDVTAAHALRVIASRDRRLQAQAQRLLARVDRRPQGQR